MTRRASVVLALAGSAAFVVACVLVEQGLTDSSLYSDVHVYAAYASKMAGGGVPYRDFSDEYPPLAQPVFLLGRVAGSSNFALAFKALMALCGVGALCCAVFTLRALRASVVHAVAAVAVIAASPLLVGPIFLNAYDLWPVLLVSLALLLLVRGRAYWAFAVLGAAVAAKVYPLALLPIAALSIDRAVRRRALLTFLAVLAVAHLPFAVLGPGGLRYSYEVQARRGLELNSLGGSILLAAGHPQLANQPPGSLNVTGGTATAFAVVSAVLVVAAIAAAAWAYSRGRLSLIAASAAAVAGFVAFDKVFSAQYVDWLVPLVPLVSIGAAVGTVPALVLTRLVFSHRSQLANATDVPLLLARNAFVVALFVALLWQGTVPFSTRDRR